MLLLAEDFILHLFPLYDVQVEDIVAYLLNPECFLQAEDASCHTRSPLYPFAGPGRRVRCFYCGLELDHLTSRDNVWYEHVRHSPTCPYLVVIMGQDKIEQTQTTLNKRS